MHTEMLFQHNAISLAIVIKDSVIHGIRFDSKLILKQADPSDPFVKQVCSDFKAYFDGSLQSFDLPYILTATGFSLRVYKALLTIPYGSTISYSALAEMVGNPLACRAVGMANNKNPLPILIPCHRVIGKNGKLTGYAGGLQLKEHLLEMENRYKA